MRTTSHGRLWFSGGLGLGRHGGRLVAVKRQRHVRVAVAHIILENGVQFGLYRTHERARSISVHITEYYRMQ